MGPRIDPCSTPVIMRCRTPVVMGYYVFPSVQKLRYRTPFLIIISDVTGQNQVSHLSFATNPVLSNCIGKIIFLYCLTFLCQIILKDAICFK